MIDTTLLGETAANCMDSLENHEDLDGGKIVAVGIIVIAEDEAGSKTFTRIYASENRHYNQIGLFTAGLNVVERGWRLGDES